MHTDSTVEKAENNRNFSACLPDTEIQNLWTKNNVDLLSRFEINVPPSRLWGHDATAADVQGAIASGVDGFALFDGDLLASKDGGKKSEKVANGAELIAIAEKLAKDPHRWESSTSGKCNVFLDAVLRAGHVPLPWSSAHIPDSHGMRVALDKECQRPGSGWHKIYVYEPTHGADSDTRFTQYQPKDGDVMIWDKTWGDKWVQHCGIIAEPNEIIYAGARNPKKHGTGKTAIDNFTGSAPYGAPSAVYRYTGN